MNGKLIIFSAPSGSGKSTIINYILNQGLNLHFSISATSRLPRGNEQNGKEYYFLSQEDFKNRIVQGDFLEYEEVYSGFFYGTLKSEVDRRINQQENVVFDLDVVGGCNVKKHYGKEALSIFIQPPSIEDLENRLKNRATDTPEMISKRLEKANKELEYAHLFDIIIINDDLKRAQKETLLIIKKFLENDESRYLSGII